MRNGVHSIVLLAAMAGYLALVGWMTWGSSGIVFLTLVGAVAITLSPSVSPRLIMRAQGALPISPRYAPVLHEAVGRLSARAGLDRMPMLFLVQSPMANAFAVGTRDDAAIAVTDGLVRGLPERELLGVLAHEVSHIRNNDLRVMRLADLFSRGATLLSLAGQVLLVVALPFVLVAEARIDWVAVLSLMFAPHVAALTQYALSRTREYDADLNAARLTGDPIGLARALARIEQRQRSWLERLLRPGQRSEEPTMLRSHPATRDRIKRLEELVVPAPRIPQSLSGVRRPSVRMARREPLVPAVSF